MPSNAAINQANAQHSTGPITDAGKQRSSLNALRHGLTAETILLPTEDLEAHQSHLKSFTNESHPKGATDETNLLAVAPEDDLTGTALLTSSASTPASLRSSAPSRKPA